jgi:hypothetical protein
LTLGERKMAKRIYPLLHVRDDNLSFRGLIDLSLLFFRRIYRRGVDSRERQDMQPSRTLTSHFFFGVSDRLVRH